ncbi:MAG: DUF3696 domain-containing protein [Planctomycetota bacterium]
MAIRSLRLKNFKCFEDSGEVPLKPLTLVFGRNNTGKSTLLHGLLVLRQSLESSSGARLNLRGPLYDAGTFGDVVHMHQRQRPLEFILTLDTPGDSNSPVELTFEFRSDEPQPPRLSRLEYRRRPGHSLVISRGQGRSGPYQMSIGSESLGNETKANFRAGAGPFLPLIGDEPPKRGRPNGQRERIRAGARSALKTLALDLSSMRAVSAFRQQPHRTYEFGGRALPGVIDSAGQNVVDALIDDSTKRGRKGVLLSSVNSWLKKVGRVRLMKLIPSSKSRRIYEVRVKDTDSGRWANFADVGFGIGQALPVLVEGLRTNPGGIFLAQEPEIHLHPDAQLAMADFLIDLARNKRTVIAETHSENVLLRIQRSIVASVSDRRGSSRINPDEISIVFVDKAGGGASTTKTLSMNEIGNISNWPKRFMEEASQERLEILRGMSKLHEGTP